MSTDGTKTADDEWLEINVLASIYKKSSSFIRAELKDHNPRQNLDYKKGSGPNGNRYSLIFAEKALGKRPDAHLSPAMKYIVSKDRRVSTVPIGGLEDTEINPLIRVLSSRMKANDEYKSLVRELITSGKDLRIRCLTGTDFFNAHLPTGDAFIKRTEEKTLGDVRVLLLHPCRHAGRVRSAAEGDLAHEHSQFVRDAISTHGFIQAHGEKFRLKVKWAADLPCSLLIWAKQYALVEPYDLGKLEDDRAACIGRKNPLMVVDGNSQYHETLKQGFDWVFDHNEDETHIETSSAEEVGQALKELWTAGTENKDIQSKSVASR